MAAEKYQFKFLSRNHDTDKLAHPQACMKVDQLLDGLRERKGKLHAELVFFMISMKLRLNIEPDTKARDALAALSARMVSAVLEETSAEGASSERLSDLMADVDEVLDEVLGMVVKPQTRAWN